MGKTAFVFSGQGAQYPGMGKEIYENSKAAKAVFDMAESIRPGTLRQCFEGTKEELSQTINTQPCVFICDLAAAEAVVEKGIKPDMVAGFSLGEVAAAAFAGMLSYEEAFKLVCKRAEYMNDAAQKSNGLMAAVLKITAEEVEEICQGFQQAYPVNYNTSLQTVVSIDEEEFDAFCEEVKKKKGRIVKLDVSGGFHSPFMNEAADKLEAYVQNVTFNDPKIPVYANLTSYPYEGDYKNILVNQVKKSVRWRKSVEHMKADGADRFIEVGVGKTLTGMIKKIVSDVEAVNIENKEGLETL